MWFVVLVHVFNVCSRPSVRPSERFEFEKLGNEPLPSIKSHWLDAETFSNFRPAKVLDCRDELPLGPQANVVVANGIDDLHCDQRRQLQVLQGDADGGCAAADHAEVRRDREDLAQAGLRRPRSVSLPVDFR
jgi:hypothetical protein